jgi:hypothetical protein
MQAGPRPAKQKTEAAMYAHELVVKAWPDEPPYVAAPERQAGEPAA